VYWNNYRVLVGKVALSRLDTEAVIRLIFFAVSLSSSMEVTEHFRFYSPELCSETFMAVSFYSQCILQLDAPYRHVSWGIAKVPLNKPRMDPVLWICAGRVIRQCL
jgi:hypothetical protein